MPRYFIDVTDAGELSVDEHGIDLADDDEARDQAISILPDLARDELPDGDRHEFAAAARNEKGQVVYEATLTLHGRWWPERR